MRNRTRNYTRQLPQLTLADFKAMRSMFANGATVLKKSTSKGAVIFTLAGEHIKAEIGGSAVDLRAITTKAGYGSRSWYCCPHCGSRRASLFVGRSDIACRDCWGLHYASQSEGQLDRMRRAIWKKRAEIWPNYEPAMSLFNTCYQFPKPKGMRWQTFKLKRSEAAALESAYFQAFKPIVDRLTGVIERTVNKALTNLGSK